MVHVRYIITRRFQQKKLNRNTPSLIFRPLLPQLIFVHATDPQIFYSLNEGATFTTVDLVPNNLDPTTVRYHPSRDGWMLMLARNNSVGYKLVIYLIQIQPLHKLICAKREKV